MKLFQNLCISCLMDEPHLVEGCLNAGPRAGAVTRLACMCIAV